MTAVVENSRKKEVNRTSTLPEIATVSSNGLVKGVSAGLEIIKATLTSNYSISANFQILVTNSKGFVHDLGGYKKNC